MFYLVPALPHRADYGAATGLTGMHSCVHSWAVPIYEGDTVIHYGASVPGNRFIFLMSSLLYYCILATLAGKM